MKAVLESIINRKTKCRVCDYYTDKEIDLEKSKISIGQNLFIRTVVGSFFEHEIVEFIEYYDNKLCVTTTKKKWFFRLG